MKHNRYFTGTLLLCLFVVPILTQIPALIGALILPGRVTTVLIGGAGAATVLYPLCKKVANGRSLPEETAARYAPILIAFVWYMLLFLVPFTLSGYRFTGGMMDYALLYFGAP